MADEGHDVYGNEFIDMACKEFFDEHNMEYESRPLTDIHGTIYKVNTYNMSGFLYAFLLVILYLQSSFYQSYHTVYKHIQCFNVSASCGLVSSNKPTDYALSDIDFNGDRNMKSNGDRIVKKTFLIHTELLFLLTVTVLHNISD